MSTDLLPEVQRSFALRPRHLLRVFGAVGCAILLTFLLFQWIEEAFVETAFQLHITHIVRGVSSSLIAAMVALAVFVWVWRAQVEDLKRELVDSDRKADEMRRLAEAVIDRAPVGLFVVDQENRIIRANDAVERLHGRRPEFGEPCSDAFGDMYRTCAQCPGGTECQGLIRPTNGKPETTATGEIVKRDVFSVELGGQRDYRVVIEEILTEQKKLQANLLHQEKMAAFGLLAAGIAHDMGNPLSSIEMHLQLLEEEELPEEASSSLDLVRQEVRRLHRTLRDLVDFARRRRGRESLVSVQSVVADTLKLLRYDRRMRGVTTSFTSDPETPGVVMVEDHLMQVALNLMLNALDAMPNGGELKIDLRAVGPTVSLRIFDTGEGMRKEILNKCFEPHFTTKAPGRGTGLGLGICKEIIETAGGRLELHSAPGQGTTAIVTAPAATFEQTSHRSDANV